MPTRRILGIDPGTKRIGVAISDPLGMTAQPLAVVPAQPPEAALDRLISLIRQHGVKRVVVGWPRNMDGSEGPSAEAARRLRQALEQRLEDEALHCDTVLYDERLTTRMAERSLLEADLSRRRRRGVIDRVAAQLLLQAYLEARRQQGDRELPDIDTDAQGHGGDTDHV